MITDHKPLVTILGPKTGVPTLAAARMQRWALILAAYQYEIEFRKSAEHANADALSRLVPTTSDDEPEAEVYVISYLDELPITAVPDLEPLGEEEERAPPKQLATGR